MGSRRRRAAEQEPAPRRAVLQRSETPGNGVLELQRSVGNRAVAERIEVARDKAGDGGPDATKEKTLTLAGLSKPIQILSYSMPTNTARKPGSGDNNKSQIHELTITAKFDEVAVELQRAEIEGRSLGDGDLELGYMRIHMTGVYVSSVQISSGDGKLVTFTLNLGSAEVKTPPSDDPPGSPDSASYDLGHAP